MLSPRFPCERQCVTLDKLPLVSPGRQEKALNVKLGMEMVMVMLIASIQASLGLTLFLHRTTFNDCFAHLLHWSWNRLTIGTRTIEAR